MNLKHEESNVKTAIGILNIVIASLNAVFFITGVQQQRKVVGYVYGGLVLLWILLTYFYRKEN